MYLMGMTQEDIALAVNQASACVQNPAGKEHWKGVKEILAYLAKQFSSESVIVATQTLRY